MKRMPRKSAPVYRWEADVSFEIQNIRLATQIVERKKGNKTIKTVDCPWAVDGHIHWDAAKRLKGALVAAVGVLKPKGWADVVKLGLWVRNTDPDMISPIQELKGADEPPEDLVLPEDFENYPYREFVVTKTKDTRATFHYLLEGPVERKVRLVCCAKNFPPSVAKEVMEKFPLFLSDAHSLGYGEFRLLDFKVISEDELSI